MRYAELEATPLTDTVEWTVPLPDGEYRLRIEVPVVFRMDADEAADAGTAHDPSLAGQVAAELIGHDDERNVWTTEPMSRHKLEMLPDVPRRLVYEPKWPVSIADGLQVQVRFLTPPEKGYKWWVGIPQSLLNEQFTESRSYNWAKERARIFATALDRID